MLRPAPWILAALCAFAPTALPVRGQPETGTAPFLAFLRGRGEIGDLESGMGPADVEVLEALLLESSAADEAAYRGAAAGLGAPTFQAREAASRALELLGPAILPWIQADLRTERDPEIRMRLLRAQAVLGGWSSRLEQLEGLLARQYNRQADALWKDRIANAPDDRLPDERARRFLAGLTPAVFKRLLATADEPRRLALVLDALALPETPEVKRLNDSFGGPGYTEWVEDLRKHDARNLQAACEERWPIELFEPFQDGAYYWTARAREAAEGRAAHVIQISIDRSVNPPRIVHFHVYREVPFTREGIGPYLSWKGSHRHGGSWYNGARRDRDVPALRYLPAPGP